MFSIGIDFGTNSVRALIVRCRDGAEFGSAVAGYPSGHQGVLLSHADHQLARQHPGDYLVSMERAVRDALAEASGKAGFDVGQIVGIGVDSTGSSPIPVDAQNRALASSDASRDNLNAQCWLWKDHTAWREAQLITERAARASPAVHRQMRRDLFVGMVVGEDLALPRMSRPKCLTAARSWVELADWIPALLAGVDDPLAIKRGVCAAGHKAMYAEEWGGLPDKAFLAMLDPRLAELARPLV